ncbi:HPF/RaiA family ribosome-associated protein [Rhodovulum sp. YNF3179]|uniref:HPF/RaiA family ribosome-associated protein n=1 Tax=Rhodovulum sp. YNF3179 TaxID=3425127 RepID=UPI003D3450A9
MDIPLEIAYHNTDQSDALDAKIRERVDRLHRFFSHINSVRVAVEVPHRSQHNPLAYHVRIEVRVPDKELVISHDPGDDGAHFDPYLTVRDAFNAMERRLESHSQKVRGDVKALHGPSQGRVLRLFPDYGFIETTGGREIYFHRNAVIDDGFGALEAGTPVELSIADTESEVGPQATMVRAISALRMEDEPPSHG